MQPIAVEVRALSGPQSGIVRYIEGLLPALRRADPTMPLVLLCDHPRGLARFPDFHGLAVSPASPALRLFWDTVRLPAAVRRLHPGLLHLTKPSSTPFRRGLPPIVTTIYDVIPLLHPETQTAAQRTYWRLQLPAAARHAAHILTISEAAKRDIIDRLGVPPERVSVTTPGIDPIFWSASPLASAALREQYRLSGPYILSVGTIEPRKNIDLLLRAFARAGRSLPHTLIIAGRWGWKTAAVRAAARDPRLQSRVQFLGSVPSEDLPALYAGADAFVFLSRAEGFGFPPLEAMACGTPVVVNAAGSIPEVIGPAALRVEPEEEAIALALVRLTSDRAFHDQLRRAGQQWAQPFTWEKTAERTLAVYRQVLGKQR